MAEDGRVNQRSYESELKDLLEIIAYHLDYYEPLLLEDLEMPQNVPGVGPISLAEWLDLRWTNRNSPKMPG